MLQAVKTVVAFALLELFGAGIVTLAYLGSV